MILADTSDVAALIRAAFATQSVMTDPPPSARLEDSASVAATLAKGDGAVVAEAGQIIGAVLWEEKDGGLYIGRLSAHPAHRRLFASCGFMEVAMRAHPGYSAPTFVEMEKRLN